MIEVFGPLPLLVATHDGAGDLLERTHHDDGLAPLAVSDGTTTASAHVDALGSLVGLTDASTGAELRARTYTAFGELDTQSSATGAPDTRLGFAWSTDDPAAGLSHLRARDYEPGVGRFTTTDPVAPVIDDPYVASYLYVANQPGVLVDPSGMVGYAACGRASGFAGFGAGGQLCAVVTFSGTRAWRMENPFGVAGTWTPLVGMGTPRATADLSFDVSTADTIDDYAGGNATLSGDIGLGPAVGAHVGASAGCAGGDDLTLNAGFSPIGVAAQFFAGGESTLGVTRVLGRGARCSKVDLR